jgi:integrase
VELRRYLEGYRPRDVALDELFVDQDGGPLTPHAVQCVLSRLKQKLGLKKLSAHQFRRTWATNYRKLGVGDLYDLQQAGGWEDLDVPQRFYVSVDTAEPARASVMDRWTTAHRKNERARSVQVRGSVQGIQAREVRESEPKGAPKATRKSQKRRV